MPEVLSALNRLQRERVLSDAEYESAKSRVLTDLADLTIVGLTERVFRQTVICLEQAPLRASDAIHVASAIELKVDLFVSADQRQCDAAEAMGLSVERIAL
jgi:predicted nucleic acid-binding protein